MEFPFPALTLGCFLHAGSWVFLGVTSSPTLCHLLRDPLTRMPSLYTATTPPAHRIRPIRLYLLIVAYKAPTLLLCYKPPFQFPPPPALNRVLSLDVVTSSRFSNGTQEDFVPEVLNLFAFFHSFLSTLPVLKKSMLFSYSSFRIPGYFAIESHLLSVWLSPDDLLASGGLVILTRQSL